MRILCLDGGGSKGMYTLGVLHELELLLKTKLCSAFDAIYGTSTGSIIAAGLATGMTVGDISSLYNTEIPRIMGSWTASGRDKKLRRALETAFGQRRFDSLSCDLVTVAMNWTSRQPFVFKSTDRLIHGRRASFEPGFGCTLAEAVGASCSAFPLFEKKRLKAGHHGTVLLADGGFVANNPSMLAYLDATRGAGIAPCDVTIVSIGTGRFVATTPIRGLFQGFLIFPALDILSTQLDASSNYISKMFEIVGQESKCIRVNDDFSDQGLATNLLERNAERLGALQRMGRESFARREDEMRRLLT